MNLVGLRADSPLVRYMGWDGELHYPSDDGEPVGNDTLHFEWILFVFDAVRQAFGNREDVFVACDLLWYPVEGRPDITRAPDVLVVFGRPKGHRPSWKQWEENGTPPQFVVEVASRSNTEEEFREKLAFYDEHGVTEYMVYDPPRGKLTVWSREAPGAPLLVVSQERGWKSNLLGMQFSLTGKGDLEILLPDLRFARTREQIDRDLQAERERAEAERERAERLAAKLRALGVDPAGEG